MEVLFLIREAICTAPTIEAALDAACQELGLDRSEVEFEIIDNPVKKVFGLFGGSPAKVRAYVEIPDKTPASAAVDYLKDIFEAMGLSSIEITVEENEDNAVITLSGDEVSSIIGRRGETLDALQYLSGLVANRVNNSYYRISIDSGNFREKRENTLRSLARKIAITAAKTGRSQSLEPMNPYERRIIHTTVQGIDGALSWSMGEDADRHVVIGPESKGEGYDAPRIGSGGGKRRYNGNNSRYNKGGYNRNRNNSGRGGDRGSRLYRSGGNNNRPRRNDSKPAAKSAPAPAKKDSAATPLYGKIEINK